MNLLVDLQEQYNVSYLLIAHHLATTRYMAHEVAVMYPRCPAAMQQCAEVELEEKDLAPGHMVACHLY